MIKNLNNIISRLENKIFLDNNYYYNKKAKTIFSRFITKIILLRFENKKFQIIIIIIIIKNHFFKIQIRSIEELIE